MTAENSDSFDFQAYVARRTQESYGRSEEARYAFSGDVAMLATFRRIRPLELAAASVVRTYKDVLKNQLLGTTVRVTPNHFKTLYRASKECAEALGVPVPTVYVANSPVMNAYTFGTDEDAFIVIHSALVDHYDYDEIKFVLGHETGHIQNNHVVYNTLLLLLKQGTAAFLRILVPPIDLALNNWYRSAEITCDRAGLLCCGDVDVAAKSFVKLACGSKKLYEEIDVQAYLTQGTDVRKGVGRLAELFVGHPYLPKRVEALQVFSESELFRTLAQQGGGGLSMQEVDERTAEILQVLKQRDPKTTKGSGQ